MKVSLNMEFSLPGESEMLESTIKGQQLKCLLDEVDAHLRLRLKHADLTDQTSAELTEVRNMLLNGLAEILPGR
ncbi:hypothetical protein EBU60_03075 [bacterium]|nr:hypothetical protein [bacterium]